MHIWRVLAVDRGIAVLWRHGVVREQPAGADWQPGHLIDSHDRVVGQSSHRNFPYSDGDFARFSADSGLRLRMLGQRARHLQAIRRYLDRRGFVEVDPPVMALSPGLELHLDAVRVDLREGMGGRPVARHLVTSPEFHCKRLLSAGMEQIYSLGHVFRSGERGQHHNPEFSMLEWYRAGADWRQIVRDFRGLARACQKALGADPGLVNLKPPLPVWSVRAAIAKYGGFDPGRATNGSQVRRRAQESGLQVDSADTTADILTRVLVERVEPALAAYPVVVLADWPLCLASLARPNPRKPWLAERFEIYMHGVEVANGFSELVDPAEQARRFDADLASRARLGRPQYPVDQRFLAALEDGVPASAGVAVGVDRLLMLLLGQKDIESVLPFPFERA